MTNKKYTKINSKLNRYKPNAKYCAINLYKEIDPDKLELITVLYFLGEYDMLCHKLEAEDDASVLANILYKLEFRDGEGLPCSYIFCSSHFIHYLLCEKPSLLENTLITRPSLADTTTLAQMLATNIITDHNQLETRGVAYAN